MMRINFYYLGFVIGLVIIVLSIFVYRNRVMAQTGVQPSGSRQVVFYMLNSEEEVLAHNTPRFVMQVLPVEPNYFIADYDPYLSVEKKDSFLQTTFQKALGKMILKDMKQEMEQLKIWVLQSPKTYVGFQIEKK